MLQAQQWIKGKVASVIRQCPGKAAVVFDKAHVIEGDDLLLLDPLLLLFDDNRHVLALCNFSIKLGNFALQCVICLRFVGDCSCLLANGVRGIATGHEQ